MEKNGPNGNLFDHLSSVILKVLSERPDDAVAAFEELSLNVKRGTFQHRDSEGKVQPLDKTMRDAKASAADVVLSQLKAGEDGPQEADACQDLVNDANLLEWAGVSLGTENTFMLARRMQQLVAEQKEAEEPVEIAKIRFWGKILGCKGVDYFVFECQCPDREVQVSVIFFLIIQVFQTFLLLHSLILRQFLTLLVSRFQNSTPLIPALRTDR